MAVNVDIKSVLICDAVDKACIALLEANNIKVRIGRERH